MAYPPEREHWMLMPGMDGTGLLFGEIRRLLPARNSVVEYPPNPDASLNDLISIAESHLPSEHKIILFAESFSGPIAVHLACRNQQRIKALILCSTFLRDPRPLARRVLSLLVRSRFLPVAPPGWIIRRYLLGSDASDELVRHTRSVLAQMPRGVLLRKLDLLARANCATALKGVSIPVLSLFGSEDRLLGRGYIRRVDWGQEVVKAVLRGPHLLAQTSPEEVLECCNAFLRGLR